MKILITGSNGLLGQKLVKLFINTGVSFIASSKGLNRNPDCPSNCYQSLDVTNEKEIELFFDSNSIGAVIHTAAMTNVDQCETDRMGCDLLNVHATNYLWENCKKRGIHFQLLSTDFIFDGEKGNYREDDFPNPLSYYGKSKALAERLLIEDSNKNWSIVRTIVVYGTVHNISRKNIVLWAMDAIPKNQKMTIVDDQFRSFTWADDLALGCWLVIQKKQLGIFHIAGPETKSVYDWVVSIGKQFGWSTDCVEPISSSSLNQAAKRPPKTGFDLTKAKELLDYEPITFENALKILEKELKSC
jgi:dTDP-4-dehydrorhamnose reductase